MLNRIEIFPINSSDIPDLRGELIAANLTEYNNLKVIISEVYTLEGQFSDAILNDFTQCLYNPVTHSLNPKAVNGFNYAIEIGSLPGVTDNLANTAKEILEDLILLKLSPEKEAIYSSKVYYIFHEKGFEIAKKIKQIYSNPLIHRARVIDNLKAKPEAPRVIISNKSEVESVNLQIPEDELINIGKHGIITKDGTCNGPLGLDLPSMIAIRDHFFTLRRNPYDIEIEALAQTWSEHCKHTIFADPIDEIKDGIFKHYIKRATNQVRQNKGENDFCVSVFTDNSGGIIFDDEYLVTDKAETHNSPSALDPFGGAITGIVGVNRDALGFGLGAKPILNRYGFCFSPLKMHYKIYRNELLTEQILSPKYIHDGVVSGVNSGGNCSGIPTPQGFVYYDPRYCGKPLVFVGTVGLIPRKINGNDSYVKSAKSGDYIVVIGGRVGKDGIHGATFSSVALDKNSPSTAVQIGDPFTQKKFIDAIIRDARDKNLYNSITDNGAGGLSSSIGEMAKDCNGFEVHLEKVKLKYQGMKPWEIWISESQERMTLAIPRQKAKEFIELMNSREVEATIIGQFTDTGKAKVYFNEGIIMDIAMDFLHDGRPIKNQITQEISIPHYKAFNDFSFNTKHDLKNDILLELLASDNIRSNEYIATQFDHEVQGTSVLPPIQGVGRVFADATAIAPVLGKESGIVVSQGICPNYSDIDTYAMAAAAIDMAVRSAVASGANPDHMALMDNFCWCSSDDPKRLYQLKRAAEACYDVAVAYGTPYISGKDSMFNDFKGFDENKNPVKISVPPTLLISSLSVIPDYSKTVSLGNCKAGENIFLIGEIIGELGGTQYNLVNGIISDDVPKTFADKNIQNYRKFYDLVQNDKISSAIAINFGGLAVSLAKFSIASGLGIDITTDFSNLSEERTLFSESQGCIVFSSHLEEIAGVNRIGTINNSDSLNINNKKYKITELEKFYKKTI